MATSIGGEYKFGQYNQYAMRAGLHDYGSFTGRTGGLGYQIKPYYGIDACYIDADDCWKADFYYDW